MTGASLPSCRPSRSSVEEGVIGTLVATEDDDDDEHILGDDDHKDEDTSCYIDYGITSTHNWRLLWETW